MASKAHLREMMLEQHKRREQARTATAALAAAAATGKAPAEPSAPSAPEKRYLLIRFGGMGDSLFLTPVARWLTERGWKVDFAVNEHGQPVIENNPFIDRIIPLRRFGPLGQLPGPTMPPHPVDLMRIGDAWVPVEVGIRQYANAELLRPFAACNYRYSIENASLHPIIWPTQASDYVNVYDAALGWAGIDPATLTAEEKAPVYRCTDAETAWAKAVTASLPRPLYLVQTMASSPVRTYYRLQTLVEKMRKRPGSTVVWLGDHWDYNGRPFPMPDPKTMDPIRASAALLSQADLAITSDTALSHVAEALGIRHVTFYSTVPAWTRSAYYRHEVTIDCTCQRAGQRCCIIARDCPIRIEEAWQSLSEEQRRMIRLVLVQAPQARMELALPESVEPLDLEGKPPHELFGTTPQGIGDGVNGAVLAYQAARQKEAYCVAGIDLWDTVAPLMTGGE